MYEDGGEGQKTKEKIWKDFFNYSAPYLPPSFPSDNSIFPFRNSLEFVTPAADADGGSGWY
jgi:hypothetical protein